MIQIPILVKQQRKTVSGLLIAALVGVASSTHAYAESFGVKFLGNTTDRVTGTAGVVPISGWNNIANAAPYTSGTITSSDGAASATLTLTGAGAANGWHSGATGDGGDLSLLNGYCDVTPNKPMIATISGLTGSSYTVYIYGHGDSQRPSNNGDWLPNYAINGTEICTAIQGGGFTGWVQGGLTLNNNNTFPTPLAYGNYVKWDNAVPANGVLRISAGEDNRSWRSPINGFELVLNTSDVAPSLTAQTESSTNFSGATVQLVAVASGTPLNFQWRASAIGAGSYTNVLNGPNISGATSSTLIISNVTLANMADYIVVVTNSAGTATSITPTTVSVVPMQLNGPSPTTAVLYPGGNVQFTATAVGTPPFVYRWYKNGVALNNAGNISGAATNVLSIANASASDAGSYSVIVSNAWDSPVVSTTAGLTLTTAPAAGSYPQAVMAKSPLAYWRFSETSGTDAYDYAGGHTGNYGSYSMLSQPGPVSPDFPGFESDNISFGAYVGYPTSAVVVPADASPDLSTNTVTISGWIYAYSFPKNSGLVFMRSSKGTGGFVIGGNGNLGYNWNDDAATWSWDSGLSVPLQVWSFVALVITPTNATVYLYNKNGMNSTVFTHNHANGPGRQAVYIGCDSDWADRAFDGSIDEVALFNRALSNSEITALYTVASGSLVAPVIAKQPVDRIVALEATNVQFSVTATGSEPLSYQWRFNDANLSNDSMFSGANTATLKLSSATLAQTGGYSVVVTNSSGSVTSIVANLTVLAGTNYDKGMLALNPLGYWRLNETSGTVAVDSSSHGLNGSYGAAVTKGIAGVPNASFYGMELANYAAAFNGQDTSWVSLPGLNLNSNVATFTAWVKPATLSGTPNTGLIFCRDGAGTTSGFGLNPGGELGYTWNDDGGTYGWRTGLVPPTNVWSFVALVVTDTNATIYMFNANGSSVASQAHTHAASAFSGETRIGNDMLFTGWTFNGAIDEAAVFPTALTSLQINSLFVNATRGATGKPDTTVPAFITLGKTATSLQLQWAGTLLEATNVAGPWTTNTTLISPQNIDATGTQKFYRVK